MQGVSRRMMVSAPLSKFLLAMVLTSLPMFVLVLDRASLDVVQWDCFLLNTLFFIVFAVGSTIGHELAHAGVAKLLRQQVPLITIGTGIVLATFRIGRTLFQFHSLPFSGLTYTAPLEGPFRRLRIWLVVAAGPLFNAFGFIVATAVSLELYGERKAHEYLTTSVDIPAALALANLVLLLGTLLPYKSSCFHSDGLRLLLTPFARRKTLDDASATIIAVAARTLKIEGRLDEARKAYEEGIESYPDSWVLRHDHALLLFDEGDFDGGREQLEALSDHPHCKGTNRSILKSNIAWSIAMSDNWQRDLDIADQHSQEAWKAMSRFGPIGGVRGIVLALQGNTAEAIKLLQEALATNGQADDRAHNAAWLGFAYATSGEGGLAIKNIELSQKLDPTCYSIPIVEERLLERHAHPLAESAKPPSKLGGTPATS